MSVRQPTAILMVMMHLIMAGTLAEEAMVTANAPADAAPGDAVTSKALNEESSQVLHRQYWNCNCAHGYDACSRGWCYQASNCRSLLNDRDDMTKIGFTNAEGNPDMNETNRLLRSQWSCGCPQGYNYCSIRWCYRYCSR